MPLANFLPAGRLNLVLENLPNVEQWKLSLAAERIPLEDRAKDRSLIDGGYFRL